VVQNSFFSFFSVFRMRSDLEEKIHVYIYIYNYLFIYLFIGIYRYIYRYICMYKCMVCVYRCIYMRVCVYNSEPVPSLSASRRARRHPTSECAL